MSAVSTTLLESHISQIRKEGGRKKGRKEERKLFIYGENMVSNIENIVEATKQWNHEMSVDTIATFKEI